MNIKNDRICPNNWNDCLHCVRERECSAGLYHGETIIEIAATVEKQVMREAAKSAEIIKSRKMLEEEDFWKWWGKSSPPNLHSKTPLPLDGPSAPGGGGKCRIPKKPQKKVPEYMKFLGM